MRKNILVLMTILSLLVSGIGLAAPGASTPINRDNYKILQDFVRALEATEKTDEGFPIPQIRNPEDYLRLAEEFERFIHFIPAQEAYLRHHPLIRDFYLKAILRVIMGSAEKVVGDGTGWFNANVQGANGQEVIRELLTKNRLDKEGKDTLRQQVLAMLNGPTFKDQMKLAVGFPKIMADYLDEEFLKEVIALIAISKEHPTYQDLRPNRFLENIEKLLNEGIKRKKIVFDKKMQESINIFKSHIENDFYNDAITRLQNKQDFPEYFGREEEYRKIIEILNKTEKSHILLTGKPGVGKSTLMKMVQDNYVKNNLSVRGLGPAIIFEMKIDSFINPYNHLEFKQLIEIAKFISTTTDRHIVLYVDEAHVANETIKNAIKSFLTDSISTEGSKVHLIWSTTSQQSRQLMSDAAFMRRWSFVNVEEFSNEQSIELIKKSFFPVWKNEYKGLANITDEAYQFAAKMAQVEQSSAGNPTGIKELLEATISRKMVELQLKGQKVQGLLITQNDIMMYLRANHGQKLMAGDPNLHVIFNQMWKEFDQEYTGQDGLKSKLKNDLFQHFANPLDHNMTSFVFAGPPGGGKSFLAEQMAEKFFDGALLTINAGELGQGGMAISKLIGSSAGYVGSREQHSILTKFFADNPKGGIIKIEEADYLAHDIIQLFTNMITDRKVMDGLGKEWDTGKYMLVMNTNVGQDLMIPSNSKNRMTWEQYNIRRQAITEKILVNGKRVEVVRKDKGEGVFEQFVEKIVMKSNSQADTSIVSQEAQKQKRRYKFYYIMPPTQEELLLSAQKKVQKYVKVAKSNYGVNLIVDPKLVEEIVDIEHFDFEKGYGFVNQQLEDKLFQFLNNHLHEKGATYTASLHSSSVEFEGRIHPENELWLTSSHGSRVQVEKYSLGVVLDNPENQWANSETMRGKIKNFAALISKHIKGNENQIQDTKELLKLKMQDWNTRVVISQLGTTGNGKTEYFKAMSKTLYGSEEAMFKISGINHPHDLANYFRPPTGIVGGNEETEFERWFKSRMNAGGGVILFDELLSFKGLQGDSLSKKIEVINQLYELLDEGFLRIGNTKYDARGFVIGITGNALQEFFEGIDDTPEAEKLIKRVLKETTHEEIVEYFAKIGVDSPKLARFGRIYLNGPLDKNVSYAIAESKLHEAFSAAEKKIGKSLKIKVDDELSHSIVDKVSTVTQGMRKVNEMVDILVKAPLAGILSDLDVEIKSIEVKFEDEQIKWYVNGRRVILSGVRVNVKSELEERSWQFKGHEKLVDRTPQLAGNAMDKSLAESAEEVKLTAIHEVYGHWMVGVMLERENPSEAISLLSGKGYLGYVRPKPDFYSQKTLTDLMKRIVTLEAGHRAVFHDGIKGLGGGSSRRKAGAIPTDDLGKVEEILNAILSNNLVGDTGEFSAKKEKQSAKDVMRFIGKRMADALIEKGRTSGEFSEVYDHLLKVRFADDVYLDRYVKEVRWEKIGEAKELFKSAFETALIEAREHFKDKKEKSFLKLLSADLLKEIEVWTPSRLVENLKQTSESAKKEKMVKAIKNDCMKLIKNFL
ncbi:MAG: AAA family ATPase [Bacteriovorax sp.]|nr:AAA family ATPase [Bacteriovorax sp.]